MGFADEMKKAFKWKKYREEDDETTDMDEFRDAGISVNKGDPRLKKGINYTNMTPEEKAKIRYYRQKMNKK